MYLYLNSKDFIHSYCIEYICDLALLSGVETKCLCCFIIFQIHTVIPYPYHLRLVCFHFFTTWHTMKLVGEIC